jgi:RNA polymerase sigma-70 factor (ECF subfamily)
VRSISKVEFDEVLDEQQQYILYKTYYRYVLKCVYNIIKDEDLSKEIVNETFLIGFHKYGNLNDKLKFKTWICTIGINLAKKHVNKYKNIHLVEDITIFDEGVQSAEDEFFEDLNEKNLNLKIREKLSMLKIEYRQVIYLRFYKKKSCKEISTKLNLNVNTVHTRIKRAKKELYKLLKSEGIYYE